MRHLLRLLGVASDGCLGFGVQRLGAGFGIGGSGFTVQALGRLNVHEHEPGKYVQSCMVWPLKRVLGVYRCLCSSLVLRRLHQAASTAPYLKKGSPSKVTMNPSLAV